MELLAIWRLPDRSASRVVPCVRVCMRNPTHDQRHVNCSCAAFLSSLHPPFLSLSSPSMLSPPLSHITWQIYGLNHSYGIPSPRTRTSLATSYSGFRLWCLLCCRTPCRHICAGVVHGFVLRYVCSLHRRWAERSWCPSSGGHPVCVGLRVAPLPRALPCVGNVG